MHYDEQWGGFGGFKGWHSGWRTRRGDMGPLILHLLHEKPMHGYEIISRMEEKSHGMWRPSAGSIYPNLQLLEEQELIASEIKDGKKVYSLTEQGKASAETAEDSFREHWESKAGHGKAFKEMRGIFFEAMSALRRIAEQDSETKNEEVKKILSETRDRLTELADRQ